MAKYHINPKTGEPGLCHAVKSCPFGGDDAHYSSKTEARQAFEAMMSSSDAVVNTTTSSWLTMDLEDLENAEAELIASKRVSKEPFSDDEYDRHRTVIDRAMRANLSSHRLFTKKVKGATVYIPEREALHQKIVADVLELTRDIPNEGKVIVLGGMPGAGKTTVINDNGMAASGFAVLNPDLAKESLIMSNDFPRITGLAPMEHDDLVSYEANVVYNKVFDALVKQKKNLILDKTLSNFGPVAKNIATLRAAGYSTIDCIFVDVDCDTAYSRIVARHRRGLDAYARGESELGERCVPGTAIHAVRPKDGNPYRSMNAQTFVKLVEGGLFDSHQVYNTMGQAPSSLTLEELKA